VTPRRPTTADAPAIAELLRAYDVAHGAPPDVDAAELLDEWREVDLDRDAWLWEEHGRAIAFGAVYGRGELQHVDGYVHPDARGRGLGTEILRFGAERARERGGARVHVGTLHADTAARALLETAGHTFVRAFLRMGIELDAPPEVPATPDGIALVALTADDDAEVHAVVEEAFRDHWDHTPRTLEQFRLRHEPTDRTLWIGARADGKLVAVAVNELRLGGGWVGSLATLRPWRGRGLASTLLHASFRRFHDRGERLVQLGVDAESPTGALRLYERAGMRVVWRADVFEKHL
jgi:ribosomal protein S18 acetylase RimI-like enzyme